MERPAADRIVRHDLLACKPKVVACKKLEISKESDATCQHHLCVPGAFRIQGFSPNWLQGTARMTSLSPNLSTSSFISAQHEYHASDMNMCGRKASSACCLSPSPFKSSTAQNLTTKIVHKFRLGYAKGRCLQFGFHEVRARG